MLFNKNGIKKFKMNINDILLPSVPKRTDFIYPPESYCLAPKSIVICHDKILRFNKTDKKDFGIISDTSIIQSNQSLNNYLDIGNAKSRDDEKAVSDLSRKNKGKKKNTMKEATISRIAIEEKKRIRKRIANFDQNKSEAWKVLSIMYGDQIRQDELISIAEFVSAELNLYIDRDAKRRKCILIKWFDENWSKIGPLFQIFKWNY